MKHIIYRIYLKLHSWKNVILDSYFTCFKNTIASADLFLIKVDAIGDFVIWQDSLRAYKKKYAGKKVILLCNQVVLPIALSDPFFFDVWGIDRRKFLFSFSYRCALLKKIRSYSFNEVVSPVFSREYAYSDRLVKMTIGTSKIGYNGDTSNITLKKKQKSDRYYTALIDNPIQFTSELLINAHFIQQTYDADFVPCLPFLPEKKINGIYLKRENKYAVFSLSASYAPRAWDVVSFAEIAKTILRDYTIVLLGNGKSDREKGDEFLAHVPNPEKIDNLINKTTIQETVEIIRNSEFVIGNDSSAVHIATATRTPSICIAPGAHYNRFVPYPEEVADHFYHPRVVVHQMPCFGCNYHCKFPVEKQLKCIQNISVPMVAGKLTELLNEIQKKEYEKKN